MDEALAAARQIAEAPQPALQMTKRYISGNQGFGFEDSFRIEHDDVFDVLLTGLGARLRLGSRACPPSSTPSPSPILRRQRA